MKLLLDTHVWLWSLLDASQLSTRAAAALAEPDNEKWLSPVSVWETLMLAARGHLVLQPNGETWVRRQLASGPVRQAPFDHEVAIVSRLLQLPHQDPADRFIAATARVHDLTLVTSDRRLLTRPDGYTVLAAS
jgi:PIN domain nuclease of toxin-antitoxin system